MNFHFILVEPKVAENVGASARALKTMGFSALRLVNSSLHKQDKARWVAHGSNDILDGVKEYDTLANALMDMDISVATSAKARHGSRHLYLPAELRSLLASKQQSVQNVAIVFGREESGLSNEELALCDLVTGIPLAAAYPSLNLSQAVMLFAYELAQLPTEMVSEAASEASLSALRVRVAALLGRLEKVPGSKLESWCLERLNLLTDEDVRFAHTLCQTLARAMEPQ